MDEASMEKFEAVESFEATVVGSISPEEGAGTLASERSDEPQVEAEQPGTAPPVEESPAGEASEAYVCSRCGRTFRHAAGIGRHRQFCRNNRSQQAPAPQWVRDMQAIPGAASAARQMAEEAVAKVSGQAKERPANEPTPPFDDTLVGWLEWLQERWEVALDFGTEQLGVDVERDLPLLRRLLDRERAR